jgi:hypothetical protein
MVDLKKELTQPTGSESFQAPEIEINKPESNPEKKEVVEKKPLEKTKVAEPTNKFFKRRHAPAHFLPKFQDPVTQKIEKILEENVGDAYARLSPIAREEFKLKGEETANKITELLRSTHVKVKQIFKLIFAWLRMLPGINHFFLEQEAKIKTDRILELKNRE